MTGYPLVFVHSPLLGPAGWTPTAALLGGAGYAVVVPDLRPALIRRPPYYTGLRDVVLSAAGDHPDRPVVLLGHSAAGPLLPAVAEVLGARVAAVVFVDARLPHPGRSWLDSLDEHRADRLRGLATDGLLPPWDTWFPAGALDRELPSGPPGRRFRAELVATPLGLLTEPAPTATVPDHAAQVYLRLSAAYDDDATTADRLGWQVLRTDSVHLAPVTRPAELAALLRRTLPA
ncbi:hypothetical protein [Plantactinospora endophytica]|uniref:Alpha/beta hydrolase n=1 Tax=Plantactinospora endophytica TaxID=673535 RepID=A0ABQ4EBX2_9ACTN|nr:hypothetical protein [Plantactinospora endophytica]GIG92231.1 hypothetical protein Pen02_71670 [Plantactinospora endophytica]